MEQESVLISGGRGLIGSNLSALLLEKGFRVSHLSRKENRGGKIPAFRWDPANNYIDPEALRNTDYIIHLAGANIGEGRWTKRRKKEIIESRVNTAELLLRSVKENKIKPKAFISASATGYYGSATTDKIYNETDPPGTDFLAETCRKWEKAAGKFSNEGIRTVIVRTGVVFEKHDGALRRFLAAAKLYVFPVLGSGKQWLPWVHIDDLCRIYLKAVEDDSMSGAFNAVAPSFVNNRELMKILAGVRKKPFFHPPVPAFVLKTVMGESSVVALSGNRASSLKLIEKGFRFNYPDTAEALREAIGK